MLTNDDPFEVLGISPSSSDSEVRRAWKKRITQVHPDVAGESYGDEAARVNDAYRQIATEADRRRYRGRTTTVDPTPNDIRINCPVCGARNLRGDEYLMHQVQHRAESTVGACQGCRRGPAGPVRYTGVTGMIFARQRWGYEARLCKSCSRGLFRESQSKLLVTGWWSFFSWIITPFLLIANVGRLWGHAARVGDPTPSDPEVEKVLRGRPMWVRPGPIIITIAIVVLLFLIFSDSSGSAADTSTTATTRPAPSVTAPSWNGGWVVGNCVTYVSGDSVEPVACSSSSAEGKILAVKSSESLCPSNTDWFVEMGYNSVACLSEW